VFERDGLAHHGHVRSAPSDTIMRSGYGNGGTCGREGQSHCAIQPDIARTTLVQFLKLI